MVTVRQLLWSFIAATTVGYGDIRHTGKASKILAIVIALVGLTLSGILVAVPVHAATVVLVADGPATKAR